MAKRLKGVVPTGAAPFLTPILAMVDLLALPTVPRGVAGLVALLAALLTSPAVAVMLLEVLALALSWRLSRPTFGTKRQATVKQVGKGGL